jgi:hypothetical protein
MLTESSFAASCILNNRLLARAEVAILSQLSMDGRFTRHRRVATSNMIAGMLMATFEGQLGNAGFVEFAESFFHHSVILFLGRACEW